MSLYGSRNSNAEWLVHKFPKRLRAPTHSQIRLPCVSVRLKLTRMVLTRESFDVCKQNGDLLVSVDVDLVELVGLEISVHPLLLERNVTDHLLSHETRKN
jgi:hypothetical protein